MTLNDIGFRRGYTGHEMMNGDGLVNMNGRIYDPALGRFLSPDNYVQMPDNPQNFNRYTLTAIRYIYVPYWLHVIVRRKSWRKTERSLRWLTWGLDVSGPQRKSVRYSNLKDINNDYVVGLIGTVITPISIFLSIVTKSVLNINGYGFFLFAIWLLGIYALLNACLSYKKGSWRYIRVFEKRYKHHLPKWRWYTIYFIIAEIAVAVLALTIPPSI